MIGVQRATDPVVQRQRQQASHLIGEDQGLTVLGEGDEAYRPHALPPSRRVGPMSGMALPPESQPPGRVSEHGTRPAHPLGVRRAVAVLT